MPIIPFQILAAAKSRPCNGATWASRRCISAWVPSLASRRSDQVSAWI